MASTRPLQQQPSNVRLVKRLANSKSKNSSPLKNADGNQQLEQEDETSTTPVKRPSPILKKVSSFDSNGDGFSDNGGLEYQSPLSKDGLIMDPPTPLFFSFTYGLYSDTPSVNVNGGGNVVNGHYEDVDMSSSCGSSTVDDPSPPPRTAVLPVVEVAVSVMESKKKKKVTFAVPEAVTFTEKEVVLVPSPRLSPQFPHFGKNISTSFTSSSSSSSGSISGNRVQPSWKRQSSPKSGRIAPEVTQFGDLSPALDPSAKKRCSWITATSDPAYIEYHDSEWGVPVHDDKMLFELLVLAGAQAEQSWSAILSKREHYRAAFAGFDAEVVSKFDEEKLSSLEADPEILQHEGKLRQIVDNAKCILEVVQEFGSLDKFMWNFFSQKPIVNKYKTCQQVPIKSAKSDYMSRELMKRGFRFVGPTIMYSFMQAAGMTNDHIVQCFRYEECIALSLNPDQTSRSSPSSSSSSTSMSSSSGGDPAAAENHKASAPS